MKKGQFRSAVRRMSVLLLGTILALAGPSGTAGEQGETGDAESKKKAKAEQVSPILRATGGPAGAAPSKSYSNEDLEKMFGGPKEVTLDAPAAAPPATPPAGSSSDVAEAGGPGSSPLEQVLAEEQAREEHRVKIAEAEKKIVEAERRVKDLERAALAQRNPLLPRPAPPEEEEERDAYESADNKGRVAIADQRVEAAREALAEAREELATLRRTVP